MRARLRRRSGGARSEGAARRGLRALLCALALAAPMLPALAPAAGAESVTAVIRVNERAITEWEITQRMAFLQLLGQGGDLRLQAEEALIEDRLAEDAAAALGIQVSEEEIAAGMEEYVGRFNLTLDQFRDQLAAAGVAETSFRDFIAAGLAWRKVVQTRFGPRVRISDAEVDAALADPASGAAVEVRLAEIILPFAPGSEQSTRALAADLARSLRSAEDFANAAAVYSASPSRANGGQLDWLPIGRLPPDLARQVLGARPGQVLGPIELPGAVALFQFRGLREARRAPARKLALDYAVADWPLGKGESGAGLRRRLVDLVDRCHDLQAETGRAGGRFERRTEAPGRISAPLRKALGRLDPGELALVAEEGGRARLVMLCGRKAEVSAEEREQTRQLLFARRLEALGNSYMATLKADARIIRR